MKHSIFKKTVLISALLLELTGTQAATIEVDGVTCNLADAITSANQDAATGGCPSGAGDDVLNLPAGSEIVLNAELPTISSNITLNGNNSTLRRNDTAGDFIALNLDSGFQFRTLTVNELTITGFVVGTINVWYSILNINKSNIINNIGGAIDSTGSGLYIKDSLISGNKSRPGARYVSSGLTLTGNLTIIDNSTISNNKSYGSVGGGGINVKNTEFLPYARLDINNSTISNNYSEAVGGGIKQNKYIGNSNDYATIVRLNNTTIVNNSTSKSYGGGVWNRTVGGLSIKNSLISGNFATENNTVSIPSEIHGAGQSSVGLITSYNLIGLNGQAGVSGVITLGVSDIVPSEATLAEIIDVNLADNGGFTPTHALVIGSPAIDAIPPANCSLMMDQRGELRPADGDFDGFVQCDVGAFEFVDVVFETGFEHPFIIFVDGFE